MCGLSERREGRAKRGRDPRDDPPAAYAYAGKEKRIEELIGESAADLYWEIEALLDLEELHGKDKLARVCVFRKFARISSLI